MSMFSDREPTPYQAEAINPYASPTGPNTLLGKVGENPYETAIFRDGRLLVIHESAILPDTCILTNEPAEGYRFRKNVAWHPPLLILLIFINLLIFLIVALIVQKRAKLSIPITKEVHFRSWIFFAIAWLLALAGLPMFIAGIANVGRFDPPFWAGPAAAAGLPMFLIGCMLGITKGTILKVRKIKDKFVWIKGVHRDYLAKLPEKPPFIN